LLGPNGAGKTTLLRILATLEPPSGGRAAVLGHDVVRAGATVRTHIGYFGHRSMLYPDLTAAENLRFFARLYGRRLTDAEVEARLRAVGLARLGRVRARHLSHGTAKRVALARALLHDPEVLLLDEPHSGLDRAGADGLDAVLRQLHARGRTFIMASHEIARALDLAGDVLLLERGRVAWAGLAADFPRSTSQGDPRVAPTSAGGLGRRARSSDAPVATIAPPLRPGTLLGQIGLMAQKDLVIEARAREMVPLAILFGLLVVIVLRLSLGHSSAVGSLEGRLSVLPAAVWTALTLGSTLALVRSSAAEAEDGASTAILASPADRGALFLGKWIAAWTMLAVVSAVLLPLAVTMLELPLNMAGRLAVPVAAGLAGWTAVGMLGSTMVTGARGREALAPVVLFPLALPLLIAAVEASARGIGLAEGNLTQPLVLIGSFVVVYAGFGFLVYGSILEG
jgi:heme exporter protein A